MLDGNTGLLNNKKHSAVESVTVELVDNCTSRRSPSSENTTLSNATVISRLVGEFVIVAFDGSKDGDKVGLTDGIALGLVEGLKDGAIVGNGDGLWDGTCEGGIDGAIIGLADGEVVGTAEGNNDGIVEGIAVGEVEGETDGMALGETVGY